jgi:hypothetical protein
MSRKIFYATRTISVERGGGIFCQFGRKLFDKLYWLHGIIAKRDDEYS